MKTRTPGRPVVFLGSLALAVGLGLTLYAQDNLKKSRALLPEALARKSATTTVMPTYPQKAISSGRTGIVHLKIEITPEGEVLRIKMKPHTDEDLSNAAAKAVKQWKFKPWLGLDGLPEGIITRLIFRFTLTEGNPHVEMFTPTPDTRPDECLECSNSAREMREWRDWNELLQENTKPK